MWTSFIARLSISYLIGPIGGWIFTLVQFPLPWILGPLLAIFLFKTFSSLPFEDSLKLRKISFTIMGIQIGGTFTGATIEHVLPYLLPFCVLTLLLIFISLFNAYLLTKWIPVDPTTSMLGSVPGGLSAIIALSESMKGNTGLVTILHTIRLMSVLIIIPFAATHLFINEGSAKGPLIANMTVEQGPLWTVFIFVLIFAISLLLEGKVPAALVIIPMLLVATLQIVEFPLYHLPNYFYIFAQLTIGINLGLSISMEDLVKAGKYSVYYFGLTIFLILISSGFGYIFSLYTNMDLATAMLSFAPGGLIEMALTAQSVNGGDPSIVSSLQMIRMLTIVIVLPMVLKGLLPRLDTKNSKFPQ